MVVVSGQGQCPVRPASGPARRHTGKRRKLACKPATSAWVHQEPHSRPTTQVGEGRGAGESIGAGAGQGLAGAAQHAGDECMHARARLYGTVERWRCYSHSCSVLYSSPGWPPYSRQGRKPTSIEMNSMTSVMAGIAAMVRRMLTHMLQSKGLRSEGRGQGRGRGAGGHG